MQYNNDDELISDTAPHVVDPINPGAVDEILHMGDFWQEEGFKEFRKNVIDINKEIGKTFKRAYRFLGAAKAIHDDWSNFNSEALTASKLNKVKEELKTEIFFTDVSSQAFDRHLFATAFTPNGIVTYIDSIYQNCSNVYVLNGGPGTGKTDVLDYLSKEALKRGNSVEIYHDPLIPERIEHIIIPSLNTAILSSNEINQKQFEGRQIYLENFLNPNIINKYKEEIEADMTYFYTFVDKALATIAEAKQLHDEMEKYYIPNMDFTKLDFVYQRTLNKILKYENEYLAEQ